MDWASGVTRRALQRHGLNLDYKTTERVFDEIEGTYLDNSVVYNLRMYPRSIKVNQVNYPALVGKQVVLFYLAAEDLTFKVKPSDTITYQGSIYRVDSFQEHVAHGKVILYRITGVRG